MSNTLRYRLSDGRYAPRQLVNRHHIFWEARNYAPGEEHRFRNMGGLVLPLFVPIHNELHAETFPPPKPSKGLREQVAEFSCSNYESDEYAQFYRIAHFIGDVANTSWSVERADEAFRIHENLIIQSAYIELGRVEPVYAAA